MPGEAGALLTAAVWAVSITMLTVQVRRVGSLSVNALRIVAAVVFVALVVPFTGAIDELREMSTETAVSMVGSGILATAAGDTLFFIAIPLMGASRAIPISNGIYPLLTLLVAALWLDEDVSAMILVGTALIVLGVWLLVQEEPAVQAPDVEGAVRQRIQPWQVGLLLLAVACLCWAVATTWLRAGSGNLGAVSASTLRLASSGVVICLIAFAAGARRELRNTGSRDLGLIALAGIIGIGIGSLLYVYSVQAAGAGKTAVLTSTVPLFSLPLAVLYLGERVTARVVVGTVLCVAGIWFVT